MALITRSTAAGIVIGIAAPFLEQFVARWWLPHAAYGYLLDRVLVYNETSFVSAPSIPRPPSSSSQACLVLAAWCLGVIACTRFVATRQQIR